MKEILIRMASPGVRMGVVHTCVIVLCHLGGKFHPSVICVVNSQILSYYLNLQIVHTKLWTNKTNVFRFAPC